MPAQPASPDTVLALVFLGIVWFLFIVYACYWAAGRLAAWVRRPVAAPHVARTGADEDEEELPHQDAVREGAPGACVREAEGVISLDLTHEQVQALRRMVAHRLANPRASKLDTIRAGFPEIRSRSGDPSSKYQLIGSPLFDLLFTEPAPATDPIVTASGGDLIRASGAVVPVRK